MGIPDQLDNAFPSRFFFRPIKITIKWPWWGWVGGSGGGEARMRLFVSHYQGGPTWGGSCTWAVGLDCGQRKTPGLTECSHPFILCIACRSGSVESCILWLGAQQGLGGWCRNWGHRQHWLNLCSLATRRNLNEMPDFFLTLLQTDHCLAHSWKVEFRAFAFSPVYLQSMKISWQILGSTIWKKRHTQKDNV